VRVPLSEAFGRVLRETVCAPEDMPSFDRSTRDGYAFLQDDASGHFRVVDTLHAADWKPCQLKNGEAVRVATGAALPCENLRVVMQENVERNGDQIRIVRRETAANISYRGEDLRAGGPLLQAGAILDAGALAILATAGTVNPLVSPRLRVLHFTTGDEIIPPDQKPKPGQIRDSNSFLIRGLLQHLPCDVMQRHLPENFEAAKQLIETSNLQPSTFDLLLVSGGASVGEKDFTRPLLEWLGFEIVCNQVNLRPGRPLIFGINRGASIPASPRVSSHAPPNKTRVAFGLPGNPLSHFVCFHFAVATALARLTGGQPPAFLRGRLAEKLDDKPCPRETLWPAKFEIGPDATARLRPLAWANSGNVACLASANALVRVPANTGPLEQFARVDFLPTAIE
jgi:molybdopterin molybdotransferase